MRRTVLAVCLIFMLCGVAWGEENRECVPESTAIKNTQGILAYVRWTNFSLEISPGIWAQLGIKVDVIDDTGDMPVLSQSGGVVWRYEP